jgi:methylated-DNA-[protein]-cysteine S-methyltransferase
MPTPWTIFESPLGSLTLVGGDGRLSGLRFPNRGPALDEDARRPDAFGPAVEQLEKYFAGELRRFELDLDLRGTTFQLAVWRQLLELPHGTRISYAELAARIGRPDRVRAVGGAVGATPVPIVVPCHRVVGSDGSLTGYGGGLQRKQALLDLEHRVAHGHSPEPAWAFRQMALL